MFEFKKLCDAYENLSALEKGLILTEKSVKILAAFNCLDIQGISPTSALAGFIIGAVVADGKVNEQEYLLMYPALIKIFGYDFDFYSIKQSFCGCKARKAISEYTKEMLKILEYLDEELKKDVITLCLCVTAVDGKVSLKERNYIRRLCRA